MATGSSGDVDITADHRFRVMAESAPVLIWSSGIDKGCTYVNRRWLEFTGRTFEEELGAGWAGSVHPDDVGYCMSSYERAFDERRGFTMEYRLRRHDGEYRWVIDSGAPMFDGDRFLGYIGSTLDVTEFRAAQDQIARSNHKLIEAVDEERAWVARELHDDIAQRIAACSMQIDAVIRKTAPSERQRKMLLGIRRSAMDIVEAVSALSRKLSTSAFPMDKRHS